MSALLRDVRYALRLLAKAPGFTAVSLITLAVGIGATAAMFSVVNGVLLRSLPFRQPDRLVFIKERLPQILPQPIDVPAPDVVTYGRENTSFEGVAGVYTVRFDLTGQGMPQRVAAARVGWNLFSLLGVAPRLGRAFTEAEDYPGSTVAIVSDSFWKQRMGSAADAVGKMITLDRKSYRVVGVMPEGFGFPLITENGSPELWVPMGFTPTELAAIGDNFGYGAVARLKPGVTMAQGQADVERIVQQIRKTFPGGMRSDLQLQGLIVPLKEDAVGGIRKPLWVLLGAVVFVLLIAVVNVANLLLARGTARRRELAIRAALGAGARKLVSQLLVESVVLAMLGGVLGVALALFTTKVLLAFVPANIPRLQAVTVDLRVLLFSVTVSLVAGVAFGAAPAVFALRTNVNQGLKESGRGVSGTRHQQRVQSVFVVAQVALAMVLLAGAGLLIRSFQRVLEVNPGFRPERVMTAQVSLSPTQYNAPGLVKSFYTQLQERLEHIPGAAAAGLSSDLPLEAGGKRIFAVENHPAPAGAGMNLNAHSAVLGDYFRAMGIPLVRGRYFTRADEQGTQPVMIISQSIADRYFAGTDPIGAHIKWGSEQSDDPWMTVVGVVGNVKHSKLDDETVPHTYTPLPQTVDREMKYGAGRAMNVAVRTGGDPTSAAAALRTSVWSIDREVPVTRLRTMEQVISASNAPRRFNAILVGFFAGAALLLAAVGLYGVMSYGVSQRAHEIGVRMTLGARPRDVLAMVLRSGLVMMLCGIAVGVAGAFATTRLLRSFLFEIRPSDPVTFVAVALVLAAVAVIASVVPAMRATRVDPLIAMRAE
jgi:predicted permease